MSHFQQWTEADKIESRTRVQGEVRREVENAGGSWEAELKQQGAWMRWEFL